MASNESKVSQIGRQASGGAVSSQAVEARTAAPRARKAQPISVKIGGQTLSIRTTHQADFVQALAGHIDEKVAELNQMAPSASFPKLLMLASMTVAEELFEARQEIDRLRDEITEHTDAMLALLGQVGEES